MFLSNNWTLCCNSLPLWLVDSFSSVKNGNHVLFREFGYIKATAHNRASFIRVLWRCFRQIGKNGGRPNECVCVSVCMCDEVTLSLNIWKMWKQLSEKVTIENTMLMELYSSFSFLQGSPVCVSNQNQIKFYLSHAQSTTGVDLNVKCLLTSP